MKIFLTLTKKKLCVILALTIIALVVLIQFSSATQKRIDGSTHSIRENYLNSIGIEISGKDITVKQIIIPSEFSDVYNRYNELQKQAGFDLSKHKGEQVSLYTYNLPQNEDMQVHLLVSGDEIIGGDISSVKLNGKMLPLKKQKK